MVQLTETSGNQGGWRSLLPMASLSRKRALAAYTFVAIPVLFLLIFRVFPMLFAFYVSFHEWNLMNPIHGMGFVGLGNYRYLLTEDPLFFKVFSNTLVYTAGVVLVAALLALLIAMMLNAKCLRLKTPFRTAYFLPVLTSTLAVGTIWRFLYHPSFGLFNQMLELVGLPNQRFLNDPKQALPSIMVASIWQIVGYHMVVFLAGLQGIDQQYYDAASVDGAGPIQRFLHITLPLLRPTIVFVIVMETISSLQVFTPVLVMTSIGSGSVGGPVNSTNVMVLYLYETAFKYWRMGRGSAIAFLLFLVVALVTLVQLRILRQEERGA